MMMSRKKDALLKFLFLMLFLLNKVSRVKSVIRINDYVFVISTFFKFQKHRFSALHGGKLCGYLLRCCLLNQFGQVGYRSIQLCSIGGEFNDFY